MLSLAVTLSVKLAEKVTITSSLSDAVTVSVKESLNTGAVNIQPVLPDTFVEFAPAYHAAPPVAVLSFIDNQSPRISPDAHDNVAALPEDDDSIVIT